MGIQISSTKTAAAKRITALVYGMPGVGKTTLAKTCPSPPLIISAESGLLSLAGTDIDVIEIQSWRDISEVFGFLDQPGTKEKYQWLFVDSLTEIGQRLVEYLKNKYPDKSDSLKLWGEYSDAMTGFVKAIRDFKPYSVVFTALVNPEKDELNRTRYSVDLSGRIAQRLPAFVDQVFCMRIYQGEDGTIFRGLQTRESDGWIAKDRSGRLDFIEPPDLKTIAEKIITN